MFFIKLWFFLKVLGILAPIAYIVFLLWLSRPKKHHIIVDGEKYTYQLTRNGQYSKVLWLKGYEHKTFMYDGWPHEEYICDMIREMVQV